MKLTQDDIKYNPRKSIKMKKNIIPAQFRISF